jgi:hypothetical protein
MLDISSEDEVRRSFETIVENMGGSASSSAIDGILVSPMRPAGIELLVGITRDAAWGQTLVVGLGGIWTEVLKDTTWCATGTGSTRRTRSILCMPAQRLDALLTMGVIRAHTSHLAATRGTQHTPNRLIRHAVIPRDVTERFPLLDTLEHGCPCRGRDLPARIRDSLRVARQRQQPRMVKGRCERIISW